MSTLPASPESAILSGALEILRLRGVYAWRANSGALRDPSGRPVRFGFQGCADILGVLGPTGRFLAVECKRRGNRPTAMQQLFLETVRDAGGVAVWIDDVMTLVRVLDRLDRKPDARFALTGEVLEVSP